MNTYKLSIAMLLPKGQKHSTRKVIATSLTEAITILLASIPNARVIKGRQYTPIHDII